VTEIKAGAGNIEKKPGEALTFVLVEACDARSPRALESFEPLETAAVPYKCVNTTQEQIAAQIMEHTK
jgi:hypothetical protein